MELWHRSKDNKAQTVHEPFAIVTVEPNEWTAKISRPYGRHHRTEKLSAMVGTGRGAQSTIRSTQTLYRKRHEALARERQSRQHPKQLRRFDPADFR